MAFNDIPSLKALIVFALVEDRNELLLKELLKRGNIAPKAELVAVAAQGKLICRSVSVVMPRQKLTR